MTLRQVLAVIWQRKLLVAAMVILILAVAWGYLGVQSKEYTSTTLLKQSIALTRSTTDASGPYAGFAIETDPDLVNSPEFLAFVPSDTPAEIRDGMASAVTGTLTEGAQTNRVTVTATGSTPEIAEGRARAAATAYSRYISKQISDGVANLEDQRSTAERQFEAARKRLQANENDTAAASEQASAAVTQSALAAQLVQIKTAGDPVTVLKPVSTAALTSTAPLTVIGVGLLCGLIAGIGAALIRDQFDDRLLTAADVERTIGEPVLGELAVDKGRKKNDLSVPTERRTNTAFNEGIRTLRTSLQVLAPQRHSMVVITSPEPGEGKTFVTASLAVSMARAGRQVILVSGDLRRPRLTRHFGVPESPGLADAIVGSADLNELRDMLQPASQSGLMILPHGNRLADPADLLATLAVGPVLSRLRQLADIVIIDSPPALALADAANLASHTDGVLVISALQRTKQHTLTGTLRNLRANGVNVLGVVCNRSTDAVPKSYEATYLLDESNSLATEDEGPDDRGGRVVDLPTSGGSREDATTDDVEDVQDVQGAEDGEGIRPLRRYRTGRSTGSRRSTESGGFKLRR